MYRFPCLKVVPLPEQFISVSLGQRKHFILLIFRQVAALSLKLSLPKPYLTEDICIFLAYMNMCPSFVEVLVIKQENPKEFCSYV